MTRTVQITLLLPLLFLFYGCQSLEHRKELALENTLHQYAQALRWATPGAAYKSFLRPDLLEKSPLQEDLDQIQVIDYKVIRPTAPAGENLLSQTVEIGYVFRDQQIRRTLLDEQLWEFTPETTKWQRVNMPPRFR